MCCIPLLFAALIFTHAKIKHRIYGISFVFYREGIEKNMNFRNYLVSIIFHIFMRMCSQMSVSFKTWLLFKKVDYILIVLENISQHLSMYKIFFKDMNRSNILLTILYIKAFLQP